MHINPLGCPIEAPTTASGMTIHDQSCNTVNLQRVVRSSSIKESVEQLLDLASPLD